MIFTEVQHQLLLSMAERAEDTMEHCRLMLVVLSRLPQFVDTHGVYMNIYLIYVAIHNNNMEQLFSYRKN